MKYLNANLILKEENVKLDEPIVSTCLKHKNIKSWKMKWLKWVRRVKSQDDRCLVSILWRTWSDSAGKYLWFGFMLHQKVQHARADDVALFNIILHQQSWTGTLLFLHTSESSAGISLVIQSVDTQPDWCWRSIKNLFSSLICQEDKNTRRGQAVWHDLVFPIYY